MYNYFVNFYNYLVSFMTTEPHPVPIAPIESGSGVETWQNVYKTIEPALVVLAEKMAALDKYMIYPELNVDNQVGKLFTDISKDFCAIQQIAIRVKNMPVADDAERLDRNKKVIDTAEYLQQESEHFRYQQREDMKRHPGVIFGRYLDTDMTRDSGAITMAQDSGAITVTSSSIPPVIIGWP
jgi:hypothetical protein